MYTYCSSCSNGDIFVVISNEIADSLHILAKKVQCIVRKYSQLHVYIIHAFQTEICSKRGITSSLLFSLFCLSTLAFRSHYVKL